MGTWLNKFWCVLAVESYSAIKRNDLVILVTTWTDLKDIMINEKKPISKSYLYYMIAFI